MRIFDINQRIDLSGKQDESLFEPELDYYRKNNQYHVDLFGVHVINIYKRINVQILITRICNFHCKFCIENDGLSFNISTYQLPWLVKEVLTQYKTQNIRPTVSITGGEPTLLPQRLYEILNVILPFVEKNDIEYVNLNTNGTNISCVNLFPWLAINVSRHHYDFSVNQQIFGGKFNTLDHNTTTKSTLQCVLMMGYIDTLREIKKYMDIYSMAKGYSFRSLTKLDKSKGYLKESIFTSERFVDIKLILDQVARDPDFTFVQQKIGDHYIYEIYRYKGKIVRFVYSNFDWLRRVENEERQQGDIYSRATIIEPTTVYTGWAYDINRIYTRT